MRSKLQLAAMMQSGGDSSCMQLLVAVGRSLIFLRSSAYVHHRCMQDLGTLLAFVMQSMTNRCLPVLMQRRPADCSCT